jgi:ABC-type phosphate/phosphonate transport system permease subunit
MLDRPGVWAISGTIVFSVLYSVVAAVIAKQFQIDLSLLMVNYGFGFAIVSLLVKLDWGKLPEFTNEILTANPSLWIVLFIAAVGFFISASFVITASPK